MMISPTHLLLIESNPADAKLIKDALRNDSANFTVEWVTSLSEALKYLAKNPIEVVLLDLALPDGKGLGAFDKVTAAAPDALILVLSAATDEELMRAALKRGAHDYFAKGHIDAHWLPRALNYILERRVSKIALGESDKRFRAMSDACPLGIFVSDPQGNCIYTNPAYHAISGQTLEETLGTNWTSAIHHEDRLKAISEWGDAVRSHSKFVAEVRFLRKDKSVIWTRLNAAMIRTNDSDDKSLGYVQIVENIHERKTMERILRVSEEIVYEQQERAQVTLNSIGDGVLTTNLAGRVTYLNRVAEMMTGWSLNDALGSPVENIFTLIEADTRKALDPLSSTLKSDDAVRLQSNYLLVSRDGIESSIEYSISPIHTRHNEVAGSAIVFHDVSETRAMAQKMLHMAQHDFLTGLANRALLTERLTRAIGLAQRKEKQVALLFVDLDNFKQINDTLGHAIGDKLLQSVANRMTEVVRATDTVCRQGGDEFVVLLTEIEQHQDAAQVAEKLIAAFALPHIIHECEIDVTLSIGVSVYPDDGNDVESLFQHADAAMYRAKTAGRNNYQFFRTTMNSHKSTPLNQAI